VTVLIKGKKTGFLSHLYIKVIFLPRQARDKHRENSKKARFVEASYVWHTEVGYKQYVVVIHKPLPGPGPPPPPTQVCCVSPSSIYLVTVVVRPGSCLSCMVLGVGLIQFNLHNRVRNISINWIGLHAFINACAGPELNPEAVLPGWLTLPATELLPEVRGYMRQEAL
jgi:hypothetical protein